MLIALIVVAAALAAGLTFASYLAALYVEALRLRPHPSARALASLERLFGYCEPWRRDNPALEYLFLKGAKAAEEVDEAREKYSFACEYYASETDAQAQILHIKDVRPACE